MQSGKVAIPFHLDKWTHEMLLQTLHDPSIPRLPLEMTAADIKKAWGDQDLLELLTISMNLPFLSGTTYNRWHKMIDIMIFKKPNNLKVNNIRSTS